VRRALIVVAVALVSPAGAAAAERHAVARPIASVRSAPGSFAIGNVFAGAHVDVIAARGQWVYGGWAPGRCGWLMARGLEPTGASPATVCPPPESLTPRALFAPGSYQLGCGEGCVYPARMLRCADRTAYANYDGTFRDPVGRERALRGTRGRTVPRYTGVRSGYSGFGVRYVTRDGAAALIKDSRAPGPVWRFVHAECIERVSLVVRSFRRPRAAVRGLGSEWTGSRCVMRWARPAVTVGFSGCRRFAWALYERQRIPGSAQVHTVITPAGLRLGDGVARLRSLYPRARRFRGTYRLDAGLRAVVRGGRVSAFRITPAG
jgi:hypothetical protein